MAQVTISDDVFDHAMAFKPMVESVIEVTLETDGYIELLLRMAPDLLMAEFLGGADAKTLLTLLQQIGNQHPETYTALAEVLEQDEHQAIEIARRSEMKQRLGFPEPDR